MGTIASLAVNIEAGTASFTGPMRDAVATMERFGYAGTAGRKAFNETRTELERYQLQIEKYDKQLARGQINQDIYNRLVAQAKEKLDAASESAEKASTSFGHLAGIAAGATALYATARAAIASAEGLAHWVERSGESIIQADHLSKELGMTVEELSKLQYVAEMTHTSTEALTTGLHRMLATLGDVSDDEGKKAADTLQRLHLDPAKLTSESPAAAFMEIVGALSHVDTAFKQASAARAIFSRGGHELIPLLDLQREGIEKLAKAAETKHRLITEDDVAQIKQSAEAVADLQSALDALGRRVAIGLGPAIALMAKDFEKLADSSRDLNSANDALQSTQTLAAYGADALQVLGDGYQELRITALAALAEIMGGIDAAAHAYQWLLKQFDVKINTSWIDTHSRGMADEVSKQVEVLKQRLDTPWAHEKIDEYFKAIQRGMTALQTQPAVAPAIASPAGESLKTAEGMAKLIEKLNAKRDALGESTNAAKIHQLALGGASAAAIEQANAIQAQIDAFKSTEYIDKYIQKLQDAVTWFGKTQEEIEKTKAMQELLSQDNPFKGTEALHLQDVQDQITALNAQKKATEDLAHARKELSGSFLNFAKENADLKAMHDTLAAGGDSSAAADAARHAKRMADLEQELQAAHASHADRNAAYDQLKQNERMEHSNKLLEEGARLRESLLSPQQKVNEEIAHYSELLKAGAINQATYAAAVQKAQDSIREAMAETIDSKVFDAANFNFGAFA